jgi:succinate-semialdehyde dehydrogenase/glutarate-semialdehyde dehydrogenase
MAASEQVEAPARLESQSPVTGEPLGSVPASGSREVAAAVADAASVQRLWAQLRLEDRARYMARAAQAVIDEADEIVALVGREQGRPRAEAEIMELLPAIGTLQWLADYGPEILEGERIGFSRSQHPIKRGRWTYEPLGVVAVLGPATEPFATPLGDVAVALMAGNGVVFKPSPHAVLSGARIGRVFARAGLPEGLLAVVHGHTDTGAALVEAPRVAQVRFTGSTRAGRQVGEACARGLKRSVLELGGKDAALVLADANLARAAQGVAWAAFANAGQCGGSVQRVLCHSAIAGPFLTRLVDAARSRRVGDPLDPATEIGPLITRERAERAAELVGEAVQAGATLHCGGSVEVAGLAGAFFAPAVLTGVTSAMRIAREELPGPVALVETVDSEDDLVVRANDSDTGLGASVWTADRYKGERIARELRVGMVWMNDHLVARSAPQVPWGGVRGSGIGRARGAVALRTCAEPKVVTWDPPFGRNAWWFPYDAGLARAAHAVAQLRSARDADRERGLKEGAGPLVRTTGRWLRSLRAR